MDSATVFELQRKDLPAWESKQTQAQTRLLSGLTLSPFSCVLLLKKLGKEAGTEPEWTTREMRGTASLLPYRSVKPVLAPQMRIPGYGFSCKYRSPAPPTKRDVVASYHLRPFTPRIKLKAWSLLVFPLQRAATVDSKAFESGLTAQS